MDATPPKPDVTLAERVDALERSFVMVNGRLNEGELVMSGIKTDLQQNTAATKRIETNTSDMVEFLTAMKGAFKLRIHFLDLDRGKKAQAAQVHGEQREVAPPIGSQGRPRRR